jgi:hypothetical protein
MEFPMTSRFLAAALSASFTILCALPVLASDHQDSPTMLARPGADITDVFVFPAADPKKVVLAMDVHPLIPGGEGKATFFDPGVLYQFNIDTVGDKRAHTVVQLLARGTGSEQRLMMYGPSAPRLGGTRSSLVPTRGTVSYDTPSKLGGGVQVFAGPRQDPFYFDLSQFFKIVPDRNFKNHPSVPPPTANCFRKPGVDFFIPYNVLTIAVEMPRAMLAPPSGKLGKIGVWATTSVSRDGGATYGQIERLGRPGVKEVFEAFRSHDITNRTTPANDSILAQSIVNFMVAAPPNGAGRTVKTAQALKATLIPDYITANLAASGPARYLALETGGIPRVPSSTFRSGPFSERSFRNLVSRRTIIERRNAFPAITSSRRRAV